MYTCVHAQLVATAKLDHELFYSHSSVYNHQNLHYNSKRPRWLKEMERPNLLKPTPRQIHIILKNKQMNTVGGSTGHTRPQITFCIISSLDHLENKFASVSKEEKAMVNIRKILKNRPTLYFCPY